MRRRTSGPHSPLTAIGNFPPTEAPSEAAPPTIPPPPPSPTPTPAGPTPTPNAKPSITALTVSTGKVSYDTASYCPTAVKKVTFTVKASDASGLDAVTLFWREPGAASYAQSAMTRTAGTAKSGTWQVTLDTTANGITKAGNLAYYAVARDTAGATRRIPTSGANAITVAVCVNTGPTITSASSSAGSTLYWDPLGVPECQTATNITAAVKDIDGVKSVTLFYRRPGSSGYSSKAMDNGTVPGKWYANLDTLGDKISITSPADGHAELVHQGGRQEERREPDASQGHHDPPLRHGGAVRRGPPTRQSCSCKSSHASRSARTRTDRRPASNRARGGTSY